MSHTSRRVSSGFGEKSSLPLTKSMYKGGSCSTKGRTCFIIGGLTFSSCFKVISACNYLRLAIQRIKMNNVQRSICWCLKTINLSKIFCQTRYDSNDYQNKDCRETRKTKANSLRCGQMKKTTQFCLVFWQYCSWLLPYSNNLPSCESLLNSTMQLLWCASCTWGNLQ